MAQNGPGRPPPGKVLSRQSAAPAGRRPRLMMRANGDLGIKFAVGKPASPLPLLPNNQRTSRRQPSGEVLLLGGDLAVRANGAAFYRLCRQHSCTAGQSLVVITGDSWIETGGCLPAQMYCCPSGLPSRRQSAVCSTSSNDQDGRCCACIMSPPPVSYPGRRQAR